MQSQAITELKESDAKKMIADQLCAISLGVPFYPVLTPCGHLFEDEAIRQHLQDNDSKASLYNPTSACPCCRAPVAMSDLKAVPERTAHLAPVFEQFPSMRDEANFSPTILEKAIAEEKLAQENNHFFSLIKKYKLEHEAHYAFFMRASQHRDIKKFVEAVRDYTTSIKLNSSHRPSYHNRAIIYLKHLKNYAEAIVDINNAINNSPSEESKADSLAVRGNCFIALNMYLAAANDFALASKYGSTHKKWLLNNAECLTKARKFDDAIALYEEGLRDNDLLEKFGSFLFAGRGLAHMNMGNYDSAIADFKQAIEWANQQNDPTISKHIDGIKANIAFSEQMIRKIREEKNTDRTASQSNPSERRRKRPYYAFHQDSKEAPNDGHAEDKGKKKARPEV
jgi:tetratricopeptide (TPR) repeat protein